MKVKLFSEWRLNPIPSATPNKLTKIILFGIIKQYDLFHLMRKALVREKVKCLGVL